MNTTTNPNPSRKETSMTEALYALRVAIQTAREADGLGDIRMFTESQKAFDAFMARYRSEQASK